MTSELRERRREATSMNTSGQLDEEENSFHGHRSSFGAAENYINGVILNLPEVLRPFALQLVPYLLNIYQVFESSGPFLNSLHETYNRLVVQLGPYKLHLLLPSFIGFIVCFFGGSFVTVIATVEAYRMVGYKPTLSALKEILVDFEIFQEANKKDDKEIASTKSSTDLASHKLILFLKTMDPDHLSSALRIISTTFFAVIATLRVQFAKDITLGSAIASMIDPLARRYVVPIVDQILTADLKKWSVSLVEYFIYFCCISMAWFIHSIITACHCSIRGGLMFSRNIMNYLNDMDILKLNHKETLLDEYIGYAMAIMGFLFQVSFKFRLPFPLNMLLLPFSILEYILVFIISWH